MPQLLEGKTALILGVANKWSLAYAIAQAFRREGAAVLLTYQGDRLKTPVEELGAELGVAGVFECDVTKDEHLEKLPGVIREHGRLDAMIHSVAFANREDLSRPFVETSRAGYLLAQDVSAYSMVGVARATAPLMTAGGSMTTLTYLGSTRVVPNYNVMGVAKAALEAAVRYLANDLGPRQYSRQRNFGRTGEDGVGPRRQGSFVAARKSASARAPAAQLRPRGGRRHGCVSRKRPGPRRHRQHHLRRRRLQLLGL